MAWKRITCTISEHIGEKKIGGFLTRAMNLISPCAPSLGFTLKSQSLGLHILHSHWLYLRMGPSKSYDGDVHHWKEEPKEGRKQCAVLFSIPCIKKSIFKHISVVSCMRIRYVDSLLIVTFFFNRLIQCKDGKSLPEVYYQLFFFLE